MRKICLLLALFMLAACGTVPITGRQQLSLLGDSEMNALGAREFKKIIRKNDVLKGTDDAELVQNVGRKLKNAVEAYFRQQGEAERLKGYKWEFKLIESDQINAFCLPGGKVAIYTGILDVTESEAGLAVVMGHEVAHAIANHGNERMSQSLLVQLTGAALGAALAKDDPKTQQAFAAAFGIGTSLAILLPFSRMHESEADRLGLIFMAMAGYDPREAPRFWRRMAAAKGGGGTLEFLSTHPSDATRIADLEREIGEAMQYARGDRQRGAPVADSRSPSEKTRDGFRSGKGGESDEGGSDDGRRNRRNKGDESDEADDDSEGGVDEEGGEDDEGGVDDEEEEDDEGGVDDEGGDDEGGVDEEEED